MSLIERSPICASAMLVLPKERDSLVMPMASTDCGVDFDAFLAKQLPHPSGFFLCHGRYLPHVDMGLGENKSG